MTVWTAVIGDFCWKITLLVKLYLYIGLGSFLLACRHFSIPSGGAGYLRLYINQWY
jgi:hypothetical protein